MSSSLTVTKSLTSLGWTVTASLNVQATIPREIFAYLNTGDSSLGEYQGVITVSDLNKMQIWEGQVIPIFANKFVRHDVATLLVPLDEDIDSVISVLKTSVQIFSTSYQASQSSTTVYTIT